MRTWSARNWQFRLFLLSFVFLFCCANGAYGQNATITGRVVDPKGASVPNAIVTATNSETGIARTTTTTSDGLYRFDNLPPGVYNVMLNVSGFNKAEARSVKLQVGEARDINLNLELAGQQQSVVVTSELPLVETSKTAVLAVITDQETAI